MISSDDLGALPVHDEMVEIDDITHDTAACWGNIYYGFIIYNIYTTYKT